MSKDCQVSDPVHVVPERFPSRGKVPFAEPSYMQGFKSPYFDETLGGSGRAPPFSDLSGCGLLFPRSHVKLRLAARKFFSGEAREEALECEVKSTPPSKESTAVSETEALPLKLAGDAKAHGRPGPHCHGPGPWRTLDAWHRKARITIRPAGFGSSHVLLAGTT